jgi:hypothetical protein
LKAKDRGRYVERVDRPEEQAGQLNLESQRSRCFPTRIVGQGPHFGVLYLGLVKKVSACFEDGFEEFLIGQV